MAKTAKEMAAADQELKQTLLDHVFSDLQRCAELSSAPGLSVPEALAVMEHRLSLLKFLEQLRVEGK